MVQSHFCFQRGSLGHLKQAATPIKEERGQACMCSTRLSNRRPFCLLPTTLVILIQFFLGRRGYLFLLKLTDTAFCVYSGAESTAEQCQRWASE